VPRVPHGHRGGGHPSLRSTWGDRPDSPPAFDLAPGGGCLAAEVTLDAGALLPHRFTLACSRLPGPSAVCSLLPCTDRSPRPGSHQHPVLRSPDLPRRGHATPRPPGRLTVPTSVPTSGPGTQERSAPAAASRPSPASAGGPARRATLFAGHHQDHDPSGLRPRDGAPWRSSARPVPPVVWRRSWSERVGQRQEFGASAVGG
jgi:hypothetical protein